MSDASTPKPNTAVNTEHLNRSIIGPLTGQVGLLRNVILLCYYALFIPFAYNAWLVTQSINLAMLVIWLVQIAPLLIFIRGLHGNRIRTHAWLCFVCLMYFIHGVTVLLTEGRLMQGAIETVLCTILFVALMLFIKLFRQQYGVSILS